MGRNYKYVGSDDIRLKVAGFPVGVLEFLVYDHTSDRILILDLRVRYTSLTHRSQKVRYGA